MAFSLDVNILLYAGDLDSPHRDQAARFLEECASGTETMALAWSTVFAYLRISTNRALRPHPLTPGEATANIDCLLGQPNVRVITEQEGFWDCYRRATEGIVVRGNLVPDAHLAAILLQNGVRVLYTNDTDFLKFPFLEVRNPLRNGATGSGGGGFVNAPRTRYGTARSSAGRGKKRT